MSKKKIVAREINTKLVAYYCTKQWDTALDTKATQRRRITEWVAESDCEIVEEFGDGDLDRAFERAYDIGGRVIAADLSRFADRTIDILDIAEDETKRYVTTEGDAGIDTPNCERSKLAHAMVIAVRQNYIMTCEHWLS